MTRPTTATASPTNTKTQIMTGRQLSLPVLQIQTDDTADNYHCHYKYTDTDNDRPTTATASPIKYTDTDNDMADNCHCQSYKYRHR